MVPKELQKRLEKELRELAAPVGTGLEIQEDNMLEFHLNIKVTYGVYEDIVFHAVMTIDEHYPKSRPSMKIAHFIKHHHVLDQEVCHGMFSNFQLYFKTIDGHVDQDGQETPRMDTTADGWSSVYTFEHVLLVLQSFLADPDCEVTDEDLERVRREAHQFECICGHTKAEPRPELAESTSENTGDVLCSSHLPSVHCTFHKTCHCDPNDILGFTYQLSYIGKPKPGFVQKLKKVATTAEMLSLKAFKEGNRAVYTSVQPGMFPFFVPMCISNAHWTRAQKLCCETITKLMSGTPVDRKVAVRVGAYMSDLVEDLMFESPEALPPPTPTTPGTASASKLLPPVLLRGADGEQHVVPGEEYDSDASDDYEEQRGFTLPSDPLATAEFIDDKASVFSVGSESETSFSRAPSCLSLSSMGSEAEETSPVPVQSKDFPVLALNFLIKCMNQLVVEFSADVSFCERKLDAYCQLHFLLLQLARRHPEIVEESRSRLDRFLREKYARRRSITPDLGELLQLLTITDYAWEQLRRIYMTEIHFRQCRWICQKFPKLKNLDDTGHGAKEKRLKQSFASGKVSSRILLFNVAFQDLLLYKQVGQTRVKLTREELYANYCESYGTAAPEAREQLVQRNKNTNVESFSELYKELGMPSVSEAKIYDKIMKAMQCHKKFEEGKANRKKAKKESFRASDNDWQTVGNKRRSKSARTPTQAQGRDRGGRRSARQTPKAPLRQTVSSGPQSRLHTAPPRRTSSAPSYAKAVVRSEDGPSSPSPSQLNHAVSASSRMAADVAPIAKPTKSAAAPAPKAAANSPRDPSRNPWQKPTARDLKSLSSKEWPPARPTRLSRQSSLPNPLPHQVKASGGNDRSVLSWARAVRPARSQGRMAIEGRVTGSDNGHGQSSTVRRPQAQVAASPSQPSAASAEGTRFKLRVSAPAYVPGKSRPSPLAKPFVP